MKTINTKQELVNFKGEPLKNGEENLTIGEVMAFTLSGKTTNQVLAWYLGKKFATEETVELKAEDIVFLKDTLKGSETYFSIVTGQLIEILDSSEEPKKK